MKNSVNQDTISPVTPLEGSCREDFPILSRKVYGKPLVYLDNAATTQKPRQVVEAIAEEYYNVNANVHRGVHYLSQQATDLHEAAREKVRKFINAPKIENIIFTRGTTESINLVASSFAKWLRSSDNSEGSELSESLENFKTLETFENLEPSKTFKSSNAPEIITTEMEHHSNIVPWQLNGFAVRHVPFNERGELDLDDFRSLINERTRLVAVTHVSNVLGTINPVKEICAIAHSYGVPVLVDGAQSAPHFAVDVQDIDCDFFAFSGHKMYGPTGVGVLYGKEKWLEKLPPYQGGGEMIDKVTFEKTTFERLPFKFEAGTPDYVATNALGVAIDYLQSIGMDRIHAHERELTRYAMQRMQEIEGMTFFGTADEKDAVISFGIFQNPSQSALYSPESASRSSRFHREAFIHHLDIGTLLDRLGIAVRTGHHCAQPCMDALGISGTVRASFALYNTKEDVDAFVDGLKRVVMMLR